MSNIINNSVSRRSFGAKNGPNTFNASYNASLTAEELDAWYRNKQKKTANSAWYNPATTYDDGDGLRPQTIYLGERTHTAPTWEDAVYDVARARETAHLVSQGRMDAEDAAFAPYIGEWKDRANEWFSAISKEASRRETSPYRVAASGIITSDDSTALNVVNIMAEILGRDNRTYVLEQAVRQAAVPNLRLSVDTWNGFGVERDVPEGVEPLTQKGKFTRTEITMTKDVSHIAITDEAELTSDRNLMQEHIRHSAAEMRRVKSLKVAVALETAGDTGGSDWAAFTGEHSTANPLDQLGALMDTIEANGGTPNTIASHNRPFRDFMSNTYIKGTTAAGGAVAVGTRVIAGVPGLPGVTWYVDNLKTNTLVTVYDRDAVILLQGPVRTETYRDSRHGFNGYITRDWNRAWVLDSSLIADLTGVSA